MTGYRGRTGIHEILTITDRVRALILHRSSTAEIKQAAIEEGMRTMQDDALAKVLSGVTSMELMKLHSFNPALCSSPIRLKRTASALQHVDILPMAKARGF